MTNEEIPEKEVYLCNTFPKMERAFILYEHILENKPIEQTNLSEKLNFDVDEPRRTLDLFCMILRRGDGLSVMDTPEWISKTCNGNRELTFKLSMLNNLRKISGNESEWNIQSHVLLQHYILTKMNIRYLDTKDSVLIEKLNRELDSLNYFPKSQSGNPIKLNDMKFRYWKIVCSYLGIVKKGFSGHDAVLSFEPLIFSSIVRCFFNYEKSKKVGLKKLMEFISSEFLLVPFERTKSPEGIYSLYGESLNYLQIKNEIELIKEGDEPYMYLHSIHNPNAEFNGVKLL